MADETTTVDNGTEKKKRNYGPKEPVTISVSQILEWLEAGETRADIAARLKLNIGQVNALFASSPKLKGKKTKKDLSKSFNLIDDTADEATAEGTPTASTNGEQAQNVNPDGTQVTEQPSQQAVPSWD